MCTVPCSGCPLHGRDSIDRPCPDLSRGGVLFVGNFPDAASARGSGGVKSPFEGYKTKLLKQMVRRIKDDVPLDKQKKVIYTCACLCSPEYDAATKRYGISSADYARCSAILKDYIDIQRPDVVVAMGVDVYKALGLKGVVSERRCRPAAFTTTNGFEVPVVCTFDLATVLKQHGLIKLFENDIRTAFTGVSQDAAENAAITVQTVDEIVAELGKIEARVSGAERRNIRDRLVAFDTETTSVHPEDPAGRIIAMSFSNVDNVGLAFPYQHRDAPFSEDGLARVKAAVERVLTHPNAIICTANGKFDMQWLWSRGIDCNAHKWDVMLAEHCLDEAKQGSYSLKDITRLRFPEYGNYEEELRELLSERWREKDEQVKALKAEAKAGSAGNLTAWWVGLSDSEREALLAGWVKSGVLELKDTAGLSAVKTAKRSGVVGPTKKYLASALKALKKVPESEFPEGVLVERKVPEALLSRTYEDVDLGLLLHYAAMDAICTRLIAEQQADDMERDKNGMAEVGLRIPTLRSSFLQHSMPLSVELARMELHGVRIDRDKAAEYERVLMDRIAEVEDRMYSEVGYRFTPGSPAALSKILFDEMGFEMVALTEKGSPAVDKHALADLYDRNRDVKLLEDVIAWRRLTKTLSTYVQNWLKESERDGYIHCSFNQTGTVTYRLSSSNPNLQNVPFSLNLPDGTMMNLKSLFLPDEGFDMYDLDIRNAEMRVLCAYSGDERLISAFNDGKDLHSLTAAGISGLPYEQICQFKEDKTRPEYRQRQVAKKVNFGTIYCMGGRTLRKKLWDDNRIEVTEDDAQNYLDGFFATYPKVREYIDSTEKFVDDNHFTYTYFGRRRRFPYSVYLTNDRDRMHKQAVNSRIQGTSSDMVMACLVRLNSWLRARGDGSQVLLTVHDSLPFQAPHGAYDGIKAELDRLIVEDTAELCPWLPVRWEYDCGWGPNYGDTHGAIR